MLPRWPPWVSPLTTVLSISSTRCCYLTRVMWLLSTTRCPSSQLLLLLLCTSIDQLLVCTSIDRSGDGSGVTLISTTTYMVVMNEWWLWMSGSIMRYMVIWINLQQDYNYTAFSSALLLLAVVAVSSHRTASSLLQSLNMTVVWMVPCLLAVRVSYHIHKTTEQLQQ